jgi:hypothetical protein
VIRAALASVLLVAAVSVTGHAQSRAVRFAMAVVGDSTIEFRTGTARWVRPGQLGVAVDPMRRDALVARFRVQAVREGSATAVITGQTTALTMDHVAVLDEPRRSAYRTPAFWIGVVIGGALGFIGGAVAQ